MDNLTYSALTSLTKADADAIRNLLDQLNPDHEVLSDTALTSVIEQPNTKLVVARVNEEIVAMGVLVIYRIPFTMKAQFEDFVVDESVRGKGVGTNLLTYVIELARQSGVKSLNLTSRPSREMANQLYQKIGFQKRDTNVYKMDL